jgi:hypothetical protein
VEKLPKSKPIKKGAKTGKATFLKELRPGYVGEATPKKKI